MSKNTETVFILVLVISTIFSGTTKDGFILEGGNHSPMGKDRKPEKDLSFIQKNTNLKVTLVKVKETVLES